MIIVIIILILLIFIGIYISYRISWVTENLVTVLSYTCAYLIRKSSSIDDENTKEFFKFIDEYFSKQEFSFFYWLFRKPFCYDVKKILGEKIYNEIYQRRK